MKLRVKKASAGNYYIENYNADGETAHIFRIEKEVWGWNLGHGMTKDTFTSLREAKEALLFENKPRR